MTQHSAHVTRRRLEVGAVLQIFGTPIAGDTLAIEFPNNQRVGATILTFTQGRVWLQVDDQKIALDARSSDDDPVSPSPLTHSCWTICKT